VTVHYRLVSQGNENLTYPVRHSTCVPLSSSHTRVRGKIQLKMVMVFRTQVRLAQTGFLGELEYLKIKTSSSNRREVCECDEWVCDLDVMGAPSTLSVIRKTSALGMVRSTLDLRWEESAARRKLNWPRWCCGSWTPVTSWRFKKEVSFLMSL